MQGMVRGGIAATLGAARLAGALAAEPIRIGPVNETSGPNAEAGSYTVNLEHIDFKD